MFSLFKKNKKGDLSLSINAIVVLILAITMLGLGLAFLRGTFKKTTEQFAEVSGTVKEQIVDEIKSKGEKLFIRGEPEIDVKLGETKEIFFGVKNVLTGDSTFTITPGGTDATGCTRALGGEGSPANLITLKTLPDTGLLKQGDFAVLPLRIIVGSTAKADTYSCSLKLTAGNSTYAQKDFFIKVST